MSNSILKNFIKIATFGVLFAFSLSAMKAQDLKVDDILAKHLDSIGTQEKRAEIKNRMVIGASQFASKLPARKTGGKGIIVSDQNNLFFLKSFASQEYPFEKIGFFNETVSLPFVTAGARSPLGAFISDHAKILSNGLFTGSISSTWILLNPQRKGNFDFAGTKKINGRKTYVLNYFPGDGSAEFTIKMFFDAENFQHTRTEYRHILPPKTITMGVLGEQTGVALTMTEDFGDFRIANGLMLPYSYKINYMTDSNSGTYEYNWGFIIQEYLFNQRLAPDFFTFDVK